VASPRARRIGLLTFHCADNFGATLQAAALQKALEGENQEVEIIDLRPPLLLQSYAISFPRKTTGRSLLKYLLNRLFLGRVTERRALRFEAFRKSEMIRSAQVYRDPAELRRAPPAYDLFLAGSDQIWNPVIIRENALGFTYLFDFLPHEAPRVSYASSVVQPIPPEWTDHYRVLLSRFRFLSVRERSSRDILAGVVDRPIDVSLDPVFLLEPSQWRAMAQAPRRKPNRGFILVYDLVQNATVQAAADRLSCRTRTPIVSFSPKLPWGTRYRSWWGSFGFEGPREFLWFVSQAEAVVTSSFHGLAFALLLDKPFIAVAHPTRGSRMADLCGEVKMTSALLSANAPAREIAATEPAALSPGGRERLLALREESMAYLRRAIREAS